MIFSIAEKIAKGLLDPAFSKEKDVLNKDGRLLSAAAEILASLTNDASTSGCSQQNHKQQIESMTKAATLLAAQIQVYQRQDLKFHLEQLDEKYFK